MKTLVSKVLLIVGILLLGSMSASAQVLAPFSSWQNDKHSILNVGWVAADGVFYGTYINRAQGFKCQNFPYPVNGQVNPNGAITFRVDFWDCSTVTTWTGRVMGPRMPTKWVLIYNGQRMTGADYFTRQ